MDIAGNAAVITGGASGLGRATAQMLAEQGAKVAILDVEEEAGHRAATAVGGIFLRTDVTEENGVHDALEAAERAHGPARILVNCAGIAPSARIVARDGKPHSYELFRKGVAVNLLGTFLVMSQFSARLLKADKIGEERGVIINTASIAAFDGQIGQVAYAASKAGVAGLTLPAARELAQHAIRCVCLAPGLFLTPMMMALPEATRETLGTQVPHPSRLGRPEEYAQLVGAVISNPMLNGEVIRLDGAIRMPPR